MDELSNTQIIPILIDDDISKGDDIAGLIMKAIKERNESLLENDVVVITHKVISKEEGKIIDLSTIIPSEQSNKIALNTGKDPRLVELIISQSNEIIKIERDIIIAETKHGFVCANAGLMPAMWENYPIKLYYCPMIQMNLLEKFEMILNLGPTLM